MVRYRVRYRVRYGTVQYGMSSRGIPYRDSMYVCVIGGGRAPPAALFDREREYTMDTHFVPAERRSLGAYHSDAAPPVFGAHISNSPVEGLAVCVYHGDVIIIIIIIYRNYCILLRIY